MTRRRQILNAVRKEVGHGFHEAVWMLRLGVEQNRTELRWLERVLREAPARAAAKRPRY